MVVKSQMNNKKLYQRLLQYVKPYRGWVVIMVIATAMYSATNAYYASTLKIIIDEGFIEKDMTAIYVTVAMLVIMTFFRGIGFFIGNYSSRRVSGDIVLTLRQEMFSHLQALPHRYFDRVSSGETLSRFNYDVLQVTDAATNAAITLVREGTLVLVLLSYLFYQDWQLTLIIFALVPVIAVVVRLISKRLRKLAKRIQGNMGEMNHVLDENIKGQKIIKIYAGQQHEKQKFTQAVEQIRNASLKSEVATSASTPVIELLIVAVIALIIILMALQSKSGLLTPGEFLTYVVMMGLLPSPVKKLMRINEFIQRGLAASESVFRFLDETKEPAEPQENRPLTPTFVGDLSFNHVGFAYGDEEILTDFNLHIRAGETVALVGASGSGKSSLVSLIPRFYALQRGVIKLDGIDIADMDLALLRQQIAFVNQEIILFNDTVIHNIAYGVAEQDIDTEQVKTAARLAQAEDFILTMENGYDSLIGEAGQRLSGGQKQRLAIARAIYKNAPIIILDEATSALDSESEKKVQLALEKLLQNCTAIVVAHRLSTIKNADRIVVLDSGSIVEQGSHDELIAAKGRYYQLNQTTL